MQRGLAPLEALGIDPAADRPATETFAEIGAAFEAFFRHHAMPIWEAVQSDVGLRREFDRPARRSGPRTAPRRLRNSPN